MNEAPLQSRDGSRRRHNQLLLELAGAITEDSFANLNQISRNVFLGAGELERCDKPQVFLNKLEERGAFNVGEYEHLKAMMKDAKCESLIRMVERAEDDIRHLQDDEHFRRFTGPFPEDIAPDVFLRVLERLDKEYRIDLAKATTTHLSSGTPATNGPSSGHSEERVVPILADDPKYGDIMQKVICGQWAFSSDDPEKKEWGGYKAVIDVETTERILGDEANQRNQTVPEFLASELERDMPKETLFIINAMTDPTLEERWRKLIRGEMFPDAKVLIFKRNGERNGAVSAGKKRKIQSTSWGRCTIS